MPLIKGDYEIQVRKFLFILIMVSICVPTVGWARNGKTRLTANEYALNIS